LSSLLLQAANIYGGFVRRQLKEVTDEALRKLSSLRSVRRLQLGGQGGDDEVRFTRLSAGVVAEPGGRPRTLSFRV
jgi:hypothetical protein